MTRHNDTAVIDNTNKQQHHYQQKHNCGLALERSGK